MLPPPGDSGWNPEDGESPHCSACGERKLWRPKSSLGYELMIFPEIPGPVRVSRTDVRIGARLAFGPSPTSEELDDLRELGYSWLCDGDTPFATLVGGLLIHYVETERERWRAKRP